MTIRRACESQFQCESFVGSTNPPSPVHVQALPVYSLFAQRELGSLPVTVLASIGLIDTAMRMCNTSASLPCTPSLFTVSTLMNLPRPLVWQSNPTHMAKARVLVEPGRSTYVYQGVTSNGFTAMPSTMIRVQNEIMTQTPSGYSFLVHNIYYILAMTTNHE